MRPEDIARARAIENEGMEFFGQIHVTALLLLGYSPKEM
jgi:hypothetical protein